MLIDAGVLIKHCSHVAEIFKSTVILTPSLQLKPFTFSLEQINKTPQFRFSAETGMSRQLTKCLILEDIPSCILT